MTRDLILPNQWSWLSDPVHQKVLQALNKEGGEARFVGSAVRESLLGQVPHDFDLATTHRPDKVRTLARQAGFSVYPTGIEHGTVTLKLLNATYEVTTLREDVWTDGRHARVSFTHCWQKDAARRDFTMNALYVDARGNLYDWHDGASDLKKGVVRFVGLAEERIQEDALRVMRFFRFHARYSDQRLNPEAEKAMLKHRFLLRNLSSERIYKELVRLFQGPRNPDIFSFLEQHDFWSIWGAVQRKNVLPWHSVRDFEKALNRRVPCLVFLKALYGPMLPRFLQARKDQIAWKEMDLKLDATGDAVSFLRQLRWADCKKSMRFPETIGLYRIVGWYAAKKITRQEVSSLNACLQRQPFLFQKKFPVTGRDLIELGFPSGPVLGKFLLHMRQAWIKSDLQMPKQELLDCVSVARSSVCAKVKAKKPEGAKT